MLYTEDFSMRHFVGFSQIGSHIAIELRIFIASVLSHKYSYIAIADKFRILEITIFSQLIF